MHLFKNSLSKKQLPKQSGLLVQLRGDLQLQENRSPYFFRLYTHDCAYCAKNPRVKIPGGVSGIIHVDEDMQCDTFACLLAHLFIIIIKMIIIITFKIKSL